MHFRNLTVYRLPVGWMISDTELGDMLRRQEFRPCTSLDMTSTGWVAPCAQAAGQLHHYVTRQILICLRTEKKLLPPSVIKAATVARAAELEEQQGFAPGRKQIREIKERVTDELLPRAFSVLKETAVWIDRQAGWLVIDTASPSRADEVIKILMRSVDSLPVISLRTVLSPGNCMTEWLSNDEAPHNFTIDNDAQMNATSNKAAVRYAHHALDHDELCRHIAAGKKCTRLAMTWNDSLSFMLTSEMIIKRVTTHVPVDLSDDPVDDRFNADFILMCNNVAEMLSDLVAAFGGEDDQQSDLVQTAASEPMDPDEGEPDAFIAHRYDEAVSVVRKYDRINNTLLQRHLRIGYNWDVRLIEEMEVKGVIALMMVADMRDDLNLSSLAASDLLAPHPKRTPNISAPYLEPPLHAHTIDVIVTDAVTA